MAKLKFFDCNCSVGRTGYPHLLDIPDVAGLKQEMKIAGIEEALVYHILARGGSPSLGNSLLLDEIREAQGLHPAWVVIPHHTCEMPQPEKLLKDMKKKGVKAVRIYPTRNFHSFAIEEWCAGELFSALEKSRIPLILDIEISTWKNVHVLLKNHSLLPLIIANCSYRHNRFIYPLLEKHDNLYIETSRFMGAGAIEDMVKRFGAHPLLFGTNMPQYTGTAAVALLTYADIDQKDKKAISGDNLRRLLQEIWL
jgi:hypothetical protein